MTFEVLEKFIADLISQYMGFLFLRVGTEDISYLKRVVGVCISLVSYICGPDVGL